MANNSVKPTLMEIVGIATLPLWWPLALACGSEEPAKSSSGKLPGWDNLYTLDALDETDMAEPLDQYEAEQADGKDAADAISDTDVEEAADAEAEEMAAAEIKSDTSAPQATDKYTCLINAADAFGNKYGTSIGCKIAVTKSASGWTGEMEDSSGNKYSVTFSDSSAKSLSVESGVQQGLNVEMTWADKNGIPEQPEAGKNNVISVMTQSALTFAASCADTDCNKILGTVEIGDTAWPGDLSAVDVDGYNVDLLTFTIGCDQ